MIKKFWPYIIAMIGGAFYATGFPMFGDHTFILGPIFGFLLLNYGLDLKWKVKSQLLVAWFFAFGFYSVGFYWIPHLLSEFGGLGFPFNYLLGILFSFILLPQTYLYVFFKRKSKNIFFLAFIYAMLEYYIPQQFPAHLGHTFISLAPKFNLNLAPIFGASIYSFIICLFSLSILRHFHTKKIPHIQYGVTALLLIISFLPINFNSTKASKSAYVRIVQPNIGNFIKVDSERGGKNSMKSVFDSYYDLSTASSQKPIDLVIWPETAFPTLLSSSLLKTQYQDSAPALIKDIIKKTQSEIFFGGYDLKDKTMGSYGFESEYNTAFYFSNEAKLKDVYHKMRLIPFGEGLPFGPVNQFLSQYITNVSFFAKGEKFTQFEFKDHSLFSAAICYEILFPTFISDLLNDHLHESDFLINLTNDSWYGDTFEPYQHLFLSKWRAVEFNIPIIRSTNTGITTIIYPDGSESQRMMINEKKFMDIEFNYHSREKTNFQKFGILSFFIFGVLLSFLERTLLLKGREA